MDPVLEARVTQWLIEELEDEEVIQSDSDDGEVYVQPMEQEDRNQMQETVSENHASSSEDDTPLSELVQNNTRDDFYVSRNGIRWSKTCPSATRTRSQNIRFRPPGPKGAARNAETPLSCFELFFDESIFEILVNCTNIYIDKIQNRYQRERDAKRTDLVEMKAFIGLLLGIGVSRSGRRNLNDFWDNSKGTGLQLVYCTMSINRFRFLLRALRFDDVNTRDERRALDKLAPIREIIQKMVKNCVDNYTPSDYLTLDEQLVGFRGRCGFIMYIPNKPDKFGIKIYMVVDTKFPYVYNFEVYAGAQPEGPFQQSNKVNDVVLRVLEPLFDLGCNVTMDNYFTSLPTSLELLKKRITVVGTLKANRPELPNEFKKSRSRPSKSSIFGFQPNCTLVSYVPKQNRAVALLSTMHYDSAIDSETNEDRKPEIITCYNRTKCGVDIFDKMCKQYSVSRNSRRWPLTLFFNFLNIAGINALIIHQLNKGQERIVRRNFLYDLSYELVKPLMARRLTVENLPRELKHKTKWLLGHVDEVPMHDPQKMGRVGKCCLCSRARNRSTKKWCKRCARWICPDHQVVVCIECQDDGQ